MANELLRHAQSCAVRQGQVVIHPRRPCPSSEKSNDGNSAGGSCRLVHARFLAHTVEIFGGEVSLSDVLDLVERRNANSRGFYPSVN